MLVREVLKGKPQRLITVGPDATVAEAIRLLVADNIGSVPVVEEDRLVGIFTERDVLRGVDGECDAFTRKRVGAVMTAEPATCGLDDDVRDAMSELSTRRIGQLPVLDEEGSLVAVVSTGDLIRCLNTRFEAENRHLLEYLYGPG